MRLTIPNSFTAYEEPSLVSKPVSNYSAQTVTVVDKKGDYWYLIETSSYGNKWVYFNPNLGSKTFEHRFNGYKELNFSSTVVATFAPTTVKVLAKYLDWYQIQTTNYGLVWTHSSRMSIPNSFTAYEEPSLVSKPVSNYLSQTVTVVGQQGPYWYEIVTGSYGNKWVYYNPTLGDKTFNHRFNGYKELNFSSTIVATFAPTTVKVLAKYLDWYQIQTTNYGLVWTHSSRMSIPNSFTAYEEPRLNSKPVSNYFAQTVTVVGQQGPYWYEIVTGSYGNKWVYYNPTLGDKTFNHRFNGYKELNFSSTIVTTFAPITIKILAKYQDWYQIQTANYGLVWTYSSRMSVPKGFTVYEEPSLSSKAVASFSAQTVTVVGKKGAYWYEIVTSKFGNKWMYYNPNEKEQPFIVPLDSKSYLVSSKYGKRGSSFHHGIDLAQSGTVKVLAAADGTVRVSHNSVNGGYGQVIYISHTINGKNYETVYAHMRDGSRQVSAGAKVKQGQFIGYMGNTGQSTGQHLHFEIHQPSWNSSKSNSKNPENYIKF